MIKKILNLVNALPVPKEPHAETQKHRERGGRKGNWVIRVPVTFCVFTLREVSQNG